jgi:hypothetical protein
MFGRTLSGLPQFPVAGARPASSTTPRAVSHRPQPVSDAPPTIAFRRGMNWANVQVRLTAAHRTSSARLIFS